MPISQSELLELLYRALETPYGVILQTSDFAAARQRLYKARAESGDPSLAILQIREAPEGFSGNLIIAKANANTTDASRFALRANPNLDF